MIWARTVVLGLFGSLLLAACSATSSGASSPARTTGPARTVTVTPPAGSTSVITPTVVPPSASATDGTTQCQLNDSDSQINGLYLSDVFVEDTTCATGLRLVRSQERCYRHCVVDGVYWLCVVTSETEHSFGTCVGAGDRRILWDIGGGG